MCYVFALLRISVRSCLVEKKWNFKFIFTVATANSGKLFSYVHKGNKKNNLALTGTNYFSHHLTGEGDILIYSCLSVCHKPCPLSSGHIF